tara:strand:+ start:3171 stop:3449 length:279 start_codon:yes stop_codon:yes gene_type:complete
MSNYCVSLELKYTPTTKSNEKILQKNVKALLENDEFFIKELTSNIKFQFKKKIVVVRMCIPNDKKIGTWVKKLKSKFKNFKKIGVEPLPLKK